MTSNSDLLKELDYILYNSTQGQLNKPTKLWEVIRNIELEEVRFNTLLHNLVKVHIPWIESWGGYYWKYDYKPDYDNLKWTNIETYTAHLNTKFDGAIPTIQIILRSGSMQCNDAPLVDYVGKLYSYSNFGGRVE
jgi:hypothetical protein